MQKLRISLRKKNKMKAAAGAELEATERDRIFAQEEADHRAFQEIRQTTERADRYRYLEETSFRQEADDLRNLLDDESPVTVTVVGIKLAQRDFEIQFEKCKAAHNKFISLLDKETTITEMGWIKPIQQIYRQVNLRIGAFFETHGETNSHTKPSTKPSGLRLERMKMSKFEGEIRDYPRFKDDFKKQVMPEMEGPQTAAYALRSCLGKKELIIVRGVGDDLSEM